MYNIGDKVETPLVYFKGERMREYKFRGKAVMQDDETIDMVGYVIKHGDWVYGNLVFNQGGTPYIIGNIVEATDEYATLEYWIPVDCVGQFTGLKDKNGVEIYEGDVVKYDDITRTVVFGKIGYDYSWNGLTGFAFKENYIKDCDCYELHYHTYPEEFVVVGNIHDKENV